MSASEAFRARWRARSGRALISVHRGLWGPAPENSLAAMVAGAGLGIVEIDVQQAADGVPVVMHDRSLERMTGVAALVADMPSGQIAALNLREGAGGAGAQSSDQHVPLFETLLDHVPEGAFLDVDVKYPGELDAVAGFMAARGAGRLGSLKIDTATETDIARLCDLERRFGVMVMAKVILPRAGLDHIAALADAGVAAAELWFDDPEQLAAACRIAGDRMAVSTFTLDPVHCCGLSDSLAARDPDQVWGRLLDAGVTILMTDRPGLLARYLAGGGPEHR